MTHDHGPKAALLDDAYCRTCQTWHVATIPVVTFACADCGFGSWGETVAAAHHTNLPDHNVYPVVHEVVSPAVPERDRMRGTGGNRFLPADATRGDLLASINDQLGDLHEWATDMGQTVDLAELTISTRRIPNGRISVSVTADLPRPTEETE